MYDLMVVLGVRRRMADIIDIECVAFPQEGILKNPGTEVLPRLWTVRRGRVVAESSSASRVVRGEGAL